MNGSSESRKEATDRKMEVLNTKTKTRIGFWNVRTMYETVEMKNMNYNGAPSRGWPVTDRDGGASLLPYMPTGVTGSN